jgi:hypothetical protein
MADDRRIGRVPASVVVVAEAPGFGPSGKARVNADRSFCREQMTENICTRPFAVDWDGDGHLDLVVGNFSGTFYWFKGQGKGKFPPKPELIKAGDSPLRIVGAHSDPFVIDWDGDGDFDLLSGSSDGGVQWAENRAGKGKAPLNIRYVPSSPSAFIT